MRNTIRKVSFPKSNFAVKLGHHSQEYGQGRMTLARAAEEGKGKMETLKAKVFISCGQSTDVEREVAQDIAQDLHAKGFEPYVAVQQQSLGGLRENIFAQLSDSEYFLFVDFRREPLSDSNVHRGSLFSHQELAIASYLDMRFMGFRQDGVELQGVLKFLQGNCQSFSNPAKLPTLVRSQIDKLEWRPDWKNRLQVYRDPAEYDDAAIGGDPNLLARWFHLGVTNLNRYKTALGCRGYIGSVAKPDPQASLETLKVGKPVELKWAGYTFPDVIIPPRRLRDLDAGFVLHKEPHILRFRSFSDSSYYGGYLQGPGRFFVTYVVISENFKEVQFSVQVSLGTSIAETRMEPLIA